MRTKRKTTYFTLHIMFYFGRKFAQWWS